MVKTTVVGKTDRASVSGEEVCGIKLPRTEGLSISEVAFYKWNDENIKRGAICSGGSYSGGHTTFIK